MAVFFLTIGIKVVTTNRPLLISSKVFFIFMLIAFSPQFMLTIDLILSSTTDLGLALYISPLMYLVLLMFCWVQMQGYIAIGISDESFRDALHHALNNNQIPFEEQLSLIKLTAIDAHLQVAVQSWVGTGQLKLKKSKDKTLLANLVSAMNDYYRTHAIKANNTTAIFYIALGLLMLVSAASFYFLLSKNG